MLTFSAKPRRRHPSSRTSPGPGLAPLSSRVAPPAATEPVESLPPQREEDVLETDDSVPNRGWYDSSMELKRGLEVQEDVSLDVLPADMRERLATPPRRPR